MIPNRYSGVLACADSIRDFATLVLDVTPLKLEVLKSYDLIIFE